MQTGTTSARQGQRKVVASGAAVGQIVRLQTIRHRRVARKSPMPVDIHAHYVPPQLIAAIGARGKEIGVALVKSGEAQPALQFD
jgi:hypothetical protein